MQLGLAKMTNLFSHLVSRIVCLVLMSGMGIYQLVQGFSAHLVGVSIESIGLVLLGVSGFFQPVLFRSPLNGLFAASLAAAIGPSGLRAALAIGAMGCLFVGVFLRYALRV